MLAERSETPVELPVVLIVDDESSNRDLLMKRLQRDGYGVVEAADGASALEMLDRNEDICLVLLDVMMPGMDGFAVLNEIRKRWSEPEKPVIMVTAKNDSSSVVDALSTGASDFVGKPIEYQILKARIATQVSRQQAAEEMKRLNGLLGDQLASRSAELSRIAAAVEDAGEAIAIYESSGTLVYANSFYCQHIGWDRDDALDRTVEELQTSDGIRDIFRSVVQGRAWSGKVRTRMRDGSTIDEEGSLSPVFDDDGCVTHVVSVMRDVTDQARMAHQLAQAQKLESIGQLAAGIAHEINTPTQYVGDNTRFVRDAFTDLAPLFDTLTELHSKPDSGEFGQVLGEAMEKADVEYLREEVPRALEQSIEGIGRVANIVRAMKEFSHPGQDKTFLDLNEAIRSTVTVATNEWKYVAELSMDLDPSLPPVSCVPGPFNQVILNIVVNAAHAIADIAETLPEGKGRIDIRTRRSDDFVEVILSDTGGGMSEEVKARIFDPFFTTKEVGKGTGQGLSIAYDVIVNKHGGSIDVESTPGKGTRFIIRLPIEEQR